MKYILFSFFLLIGSLSTHAQFKEGLQVGDQAPFFKAYDQHHNYVSNSGLMNEHEGLLVLFYRGNWCSYCKKQLMELQDSLSMIKDKNYAVVVITPEKPESIDEMILKTGARFPILYDQNYVIMKDYLVDFKISEETVPGKSKKTQSLTRKANKNEDDILPVPAVYLIKKNGLVSWRFYNPDYRVRPSIAEILTHL